MSQLDLDLTTERSRPRRSFRMLLAGSLLVAVGALAFEASEAAQPTIIIPPQVENTAELPPVAGEFTASITPPARLAQKGAEGAPSALSFAERNVFLSLLLICFAVMSAGSFSLWRRGFREMAKSPVREK